MRIRYATSLAGITAEKLRGFFEGWPDPPTPQTLLRILRGSNRIVLAIDGEEPRVVGFINALSDGVLTAFIPLIEVLPDYRGRGVGRELVGRMLSELGNLYSIDLICDPELQPFYESLGMKRQTGMIVRNMEAQSGRRG